MISLDELVKFVAINGWAEFFPTDPMMVETFFHYVPWHNNVFRMCCYCSVVYIIHDLVVWTVSKNKTE